MPRRSWWGPALLCVLLAIAGCTDSKKGVAATSSSTSIAPTTSEGQRSCDPPKDTTPVSVQAFGTEGRDFTVESFDGTEIRAHWFPNPAATADQPKPTVLMGPGWSLGGATDVDQSSILGSIDIHSLLEAGYNVLTWDPRGFGASTGTAMVDSKDFEGRDVQQLIDWIATLPQVELDAERDPRMGMVGGSYGGGIQLVAAAIDCRVDAIVPIVAWHSLQSSLYKNKTVKVGWAKVLSDASIMSNIDPHIRSASDSAMTGGSLSDEDLQWFIDRGPGHLVKEIEVPTLLIHGTIDTLFTLEEAVENYQILSSNDVPVAMLWNCDGHGVCLTNPGDPNRAKDAAIKWLNRYVAGDSSVDTGPAFDIIDQNGKRFVADRYKPRMDDVFKGQGSGTLAFVASGGAGPVDPASATGQVVAGIAAGITPTRAENAVATVITADRDALVVGAPEVELTYRGTASTDDESGRPTRVFVQLVDEQTRLVIGNQITPVEVTLDGREHRIEVPLEIIAHSLSKGDRVTVQVVATTVAYAQPQLGGKIEFTRIKASLPIADWLKPAK